MPSMAEVRRRREHLVGLGAVLAAVVLASLRLWPVPEAAAEDAVLEAILNDAVVIGLLRLAIVVLALYGIASVPALIIGGRWAKGVGTSGIVADDPRADLPAGLVDLLRQIAELEFENARLLDERDELLTLLDDETRPA